MSVSSSKKISSVTSSAPKTSRIFNNNQSQFVENIDTSNNVLTRDGNDENSNKDQRHPSAKTPPTDFKSASPDISTSIEALAMSGIFETDGMASPINSKQIGVYNNNQTIIKDEEVERTGRNYLKHFYEKNQHFIDVDELV